MVLITSAKTVNAKVFLFVVLGSLLSETWGKGEGFLSFENHKQAGVPNPLKLFFSSDTFETDQELEAAMQQALGHGHGLTEEEGAKKTAQISAMFETMPKNMYGKVGRDTMAYMVSRYFGEQYG